MKILFVCAHNRFRSKVAEALFNKYNKNKGNEVKSAGAALDPLYHYVHENVVNALAEKGAKVVDEQSVQLDEHLIDWADKIILVADNVNPELFPKEKLEIWKIADCEQHDIGPIKDRVEKIDKKVKELVRRLKEQISL